MSLLSNLSSLKNYILAFLGMFGTAYVIKQKYNVYKTETKLHNIDKAISKANIEMIKENAKHREDNISLEKEILKSTVENLNDLKEKTSDELVKLRTDLHSKKEIII